MSPLLITLLGVMLVPLFVGTWRTSLLGLSCQGFVLAWIAFRGAPDFGNPSDWVTMADLILLRAIAAPLLLARVLKSQNVPNRNDVIPPNLLSWTIALGMVLVAFNLAQSLVPESGDAQTHVAVAATGLLLGFLVLGTQSGHFSQMVGALRIENAIALFELGGERGHTLIGVQLGQLAVVALTVFYFRRSLAALGAPPAAAESQPEGPTL